MISGYAHFQNVMRNDWGKTKNLMRMQGKYCSLPIMTNTSNYHFPFINAQKQEFQKQSDPKDLGYTPFCPILFHYTPFFCYWMAISLMLVPYQLIPIYLFVISLYFCVHLGRFFKVFITLILWYSCGFATIPFSHSKTAVGC